MTANLAELLTKAAAAAPEAPALVDTGSGRRLTWGELDDEVTRLANGLRGLGLVAGNRVLVSMGNGADFVSSYFATLRAGLVAVPANPRAATGELARVLADSGARIAMADAATVTGIRAAVAGLRDALESDAELKARVPVPHIVVAGAPALPGETPFAGLLAAAADPLPTPLDPESLAVLLYTSGTSGRPRGAMLSHRALVANIEQAAAVEPAMIRSTDVVLGVLPLFHIYGLNAVLGQVVFNHARLVLVDGFDVEGSLDVIAREGVTVAPVAPPVFAYWRGVDDLSQRLDSVRTLISGSAPLSPDLVEELVVRTGVTVHQGYGLTEAAPIVTSTMCSRTLKRGSVGAALPGVEIRLVDDSGHPPEGEDAGEIQVRGDNLFSGYWPDGSDGPQGGWYPTGDVGFLDADGDLFLVDRLKELVIVSGFNVYPSEVEDVIGEVDGVAEAAVIGAEDERTGEAVVAYVCRKPGLSDSDEVLTARVREHCATRLARFKQPREVLVVTELPHTGTGKVAKGLLRATRRRRDIGLLE